MVAKILQSPPKIEFVGGLVRTVADSGAPVYWKPKAARAFAKKMLRKIERHNRDKIVRLRAK